MSVHCSWANKTDLPELEAFVLKYYGPQSVQAQTGRFRWLFADNPEGMHVLTGRIDGCLVAVCGHLPKKLHFKEKTINAAYGVDLFVAPEHRRTGIGRHFLQERLDRFEISLSSGQSSAMASLYQGEDTAILSHFKRGLFVRQPCFEGGAKAILRESITWMLGKYKGTGGRRTPLTLDAAIKWLKENHPTQTTDDSFRWRFDGPIYRDYLFSLLEIPNGHGLLVTRNEIKQEVIINLYCEPSQRCYMLGCAARTSPSAAISLLCAGNILDHELKNQGYLVRSEDAWVVAMSRNHSLIQSLEDTPWLSFAVDSDSDLLRFGNRVNT